MPQINTSVNRVHRTVTGGDWLVAENNADGAVISFMPELEMAAAEYQGNFHVLNPQDCMLAVYDTALGSSDDPAAQSRSGTIMLYWQEVVETGGEEESVFYSVPGCKVVEAPVLQDFTVSETGWLILKLTRLANSGGDYSFYDDYLGNVYLSWSWEFVLNLPAMKEGSTYLPVAGIIVDQDTLTLTVVQQQFGPGVMWLPITPEEQSSSSSSSSSESVSSDSSSSSSSSSSSDASESSDSLADSSSSGSGGITYVDIAVTFSYTENTEARDDADGTFNMSGEVQLSGTFQGCSQYPEGGYQLTLTGWEKYDSGDGNGAQTSEISHQMTVFRNEALDRWEFYDADAFDWADNLNGVDDVNDIDYSTPMYVFPTLQSMPTYPSGTIMVDHKIINGVSESPPLFVLTSCLRVTFAPQK